MHGCGDVQDPGNAAARLWYPTYTRDTDVEFVKGGCLFRLSEMDNLVDRTRERCEVQN